MRLPKHLSVRKRSHRRVTLKLLRLIFSFALLVPATASVAAYELPSYPQDNGALRSIVARLPETAKLGEAIDLSVDLKVNTRVNQDRKLWLHLIKGGQVYFVEAIQPQPPPAEWTPGRTANLTGIRVTIPADLNPGDYTYEVGMYLEKPTAKGAIRLEGASKPGKPMVITTGTFLDKYGTPHYWHINKAHTLIWDGQPFMPAGGMFIYDRDWNLVKAQLDLLKKYGIKNIYLHLGVNQPYVWKDYSDDDYRFFQQTIDYLDDNGFTYGIEFQALEAKGPGYNYPGSGIGVDAKTSGVVRAETKEPKSAVFIVCDKPTGKIVQTGTARVVEGKFLEADVKVSVPGDYRVVFAADRAGPDGYVMYYWDDKYETYVKKVRSHYSKVKLGPGFRFLADPLWNEMNNSHDFVPSAPAFAEQFTRWLEDRYGTIEKLNDAWAPADAKWATFGAAGSTISIERMDDRATGKLMQYCYSRTAKRFYSMEACRSQFNYDLREFIGKSLLYYCNDIADVFKQMNNVPVIYKCFTDIDWWHIPDSWTASGHDGLGMESYGNGEPMLLFMAIHVYGECEQATKTTWLIVTETGEGNHQDASPSRNKLMGYTDRLGTMYANYNALISAGAKGVYQFNMIGGRGMNDPWSDNLSRDPRQLEWLATYDRILANAANLVDYKPTVYYRFPGHFHPCSMELWSDPCNDFANMGGWWWREPVERAQNDIWIVPSFSLRPDTPMFIVNIENMPASERFAAELTSAIDQGKRLTMIGFRKDLGTIPTVDKYYTPRFSVNERGRKIQVLTPTATSRILGKTPKGEVWNLIDGNVQINSEEVFGQHGYQPQGLAFGPEKPVDPYDGVFNDLLGVTLLDLGPDLAGFTYQDNGTPVTVISARKGEVTVSLPASQGMECRYPSGATAGKTEGNSVKVSLAPADKTLIKAKYDWGPDGILIDSLNTMETVIARGLDGNAALAAVGVKTAAVPDASCIWIEGEKPISHNFNYSTFGGIPTLSGNAFLGLETAVTPPADTGWYATYSFDAPIPPGIIPGGMGLDAPKAGAYQLWLRENYLSYSSPCSYRIDDGPWVSAPNTFVPRDTEMVALYNAVEDSRQIFAWYHYGAVKLTGGKHTITFRVNEPRPYGTVLTMANDRPYAKLIDCIVLAPGGFTPKGKEKPAHLSEQVEKPMVNLLPNPSVEFDSNRDEKCDGWTPSQADGLEWTKPGWGNVKVEGLYDINLNLKDAYSEMRALKITGGPEERVWSSEPTPLPPPLGKGGQEGVGAGSSFLALGWIRATGPSPEAFFRVQWLDSSGKLLRGDVLRPSVLTTDWREISATLARPSGAKSVVFQCVLGKASNGAASFDDMVFAAE